MKRWLKRLGLLLASPAGVAVIFLGSYSFDDALFDPNAGGPLVIQDRSGRVLRSIPAPDGRPGREQWVSLSDISSHAVLTLIASEDQEFYEHAGVDVVALGRAAYLMATTGDRFGGSTISMQLAKMLHHAGEPRTVWRKLLEMRAALGIERNLSKAEILEQYLNRAYYGHGAYGIEAAAQRYFGKPAKTLSVAEATFLAVLPRGPSFYDPVEHLDRALARREHLFALLVEQGRLSQAEAERALAQAIEPELHVASRVFEAPHFVDWVLAELPDDTKARGGTVVTTLDLDLQQALEHRTRDHVATQRHLDVREAGVVVLDAETAEVRAMVGSPDYAASQLNIVTRRRYPGSALKPFVYAAAIENGASPATIAFDVSDISEVYRDPGPERGPVSYREALSGSLNFAAVHVIEQVGVPLTMGYLQQAGVSELRQGSDEYGSRLALGSTKVRLLDLVAGYRFLVRDGVVRAPSGVVESRLVDGRIAFRTEPSERSVFSPQTSWMVMDMLADSDARRATFGYELPVDLPYRVVAKTGTAQGFSDTVAVFATDDYLIGAWAGRFDGGASQGRFGMAAAAPLARAALLLAADSRPQTLPDPPPQLVRAEVCALSGLAATSNCHHRRHDWFRQGTVPTEPCNCHRNTTTTYAPQLTGWLRRTGRL